METRTTDTGTVDGTKRNWMIELAQRVRGAERVIVTKFKPTSVNVGFVKSVCQDNQLFIRSWNDDLILEKLAFD